MFLLPNTLNSFLKIGSPAPAIETGLYKGPELAEIPPQLLGKLVWLRRLNDIAFGGNSIPSRLDLELEKKFTRNLASLAGLSFESKQFCFAHARKVFCDCAIEVPRSFGERVSCIFNE